MAKNGSINRYSKQLLTNINPHDLTNFPNKAAASFTPSVRGRLRAPLKTAMDTTKWDAPNGK